MPIVMSITEVHVTFVWLCGNSDSFV